MLKGGVEERINKRLDKLKSHQARNYFLSNITYPIKEQKFDAHLVNNSIKQIEEVLPKILGLIREIKKYFKNIYDQNNIVASYLLLGKTYKNLQCVSREAKNGNASIVVELCRSGQEALDLVFLFSEAKGQKYLKKWFKGEIISNKEARELMDKSVNEMLTSLSKSQVSVRDMKADVYWIYSLFTHSGFGSLLDMIDVYHEDFDFDGYAGFHYTRKYLHLVDNMVVSILLGLKNIFLVCKDLKNLSKTESLLASFGSQFASPEEIVETQKKYKK